MPTYLFRCATCGDTERAFPMASVPATLDCPACGASARRRPTGAVLGVGTSPAMRLLDATARSASEPAVVPSVPAAGRRRVRPVTTNPLHRRLPRP